MMDILLVYHPKTKIILEQESPYKMQCDKCHAVYDNQYLKYKIDEIFIKLLKAGWYEVKRGSTNETEKIN